MAIQRKRQPKKLYYFTTEESGDDCVTSDLYGTFAEAELHAYETAQKIKEDVYINESESIVGVEHYDGEDAE